MKNIVKILALMAVVAALGISTVSATCIPAKDFSSWNFTRGVYYYVYFAADSAVVDARGGLPAGQGGAFWQPGNRDGANEGGYTVDQWLGYYPAYGWYLNGNLGNGSVVGCPAGELVVVSTDPSPAGGTRTDIFITQATEDPSEAPFFFTGPGLTFQPMPSPEVTGSSRDATNVLVDLQFADPARSFYTTYSAVATDFITDIVLFSAKGADPGRDVAGWTEIARFPYAGGQTTAPAFTVDCTDPADTFLAAGLALADGYVPTHVSASVAIECDPNLADPDAKFDLIRERGKGQKRGKPFQQ
jgi:hypothetical protein